MAERASDRLLRMLGMITYLDRHEGVSIEEISRLVGHSGTSVTELVYRHQIRPVLQTGAVAMDTLFGTGDAER